MQKNEKNELEKLILKILEKGVTTRFFFYKLLQHVKGRRERNLKEKAHSWYWTIRALRREKMMDGAVFKENMILAVESDLMTVVYHLTSHNNQSSDLIHPL